MTTLIPIRRASLRALTLAAGAAVALIATTTLAGAPAQAAGPLQGGGGGDKSISISGATSCAADASKRTVTWTLANSGDTDATIESVDAGSATAVVTGDPAVPLAGAVIPKKSGGHSGTLTATATLPGDATSAALKITVSWADAQGNHHAEHFGGQNSHEFTGYVRHIQGTCTNPGACVSAANAHYTHTFDGPAGTATVAVAGDLPLCDGDSQDFLLVSYYAPSAKATWPQYAFDHQVGTIDHTHSSVALKVNLTGCYTQVDLVWGKDLINPMVANGPRYDNRKLGSGGAPGSRSKGPAAWYNGGTTTCAAPAATMVSACSGEVTVHLSNALEAHYDAPFVVTAGADSSFKQTVTVSPGKSADVLVPADKAGTITVTMDNKVVAQGMWQPGHCSAPTVQAESTCDSLKITVSNPEGNLTTDVAIAYGAQTKNFSVAPGKSETVTFAASTETEATVTFTDFRKTVTVVYNRPADCESPSPQPSTPASHVPSPSHSGSPGLPVTGVQVGAFAGAGALLLAAGAALFVFTRRRRLTES
ncbi:hypothetical protein [Hamadaea tsunoensis]|uniref:hypothetical protein n=1 Tax=Hamadaea tsunoensis TaxID=53368 RepID=UPI00041D5ABB|nr:hypothetical protein [Hamadaea tsunoensis]